MFLCALCGKLYDNEAISLKVLLKQKDYNDDSEKELSVESCCLCYGLLNTKYVVGNNNSFNITPKSKLKLYKISSYNFENKNAEKKAKIIADKPVAKKITEILKKVENDEKKKSKKSKSSLQ
jgi:hypothetical protein